MKNFRLNILVRLLLLTLSLGGLIFLLIRAELIATTIFVGVLTLLQIISLIRYVENTNRILQTFFSSIRFDDFTSLMGFSIKGKSFDELNSELEHVMRRFQQVRMEKEANYRYLEQVIHHLSIPTLSIKNREEINFFNRAAKRLFQVSHLSRLNELDPILVQTIRQMKAHERQFVNLTRNQEILSLVLYLTEFKLDAETYQLVSFQNIRTEVEKIEVDAWQKLIRVLTHEIMNSITPISTLADTLQNLLSSGQKAPSGSVNLSANQARDALHALNIIQTRSKGLMGFVESYRSVTRLETPSFERILIFEVLSDIQRLFRKQADQKEVDFQVECEPQDLEISADPQLLEQVLINLVLNALEALMLSDSAVLTLRAYINPLNERIISVKDNGTGIPDEQLEEIFIPFFSTKSEGSGVGLSISRQIMQQMGGSILVRTELGKGSEFLLVWG